MSNGGAESHSTRDTSERESISGHEQSSRVTTQLPEIKIIDGKAEINGKRYDRVVVNIGDSAALAALDSLQDGNTAAIIIDPAAQVAQQIITELQRGETNFAFLGEGNTATILESLDRERRLNTSTWHELQGEYQKRWGKAQANKGNLFLVGARIEDIIPTQVFADKVTYNYPAPTNPLSQPYHFAMKVLRQTGRMEVITESDMIANHFINIAHEGGNSVADTIIPKRSDTLMHPYVSSHDVVLRKRFQTHHVTITPK